MKLQSALSLFALSASALIGQTQTLFVPTGTSGIGDNTTNGNVGIGVQNPIPWTKLDVRGGQIGSEASGGSGWGGTDGTRGFRVGWSSGYGASFEAWDGNSPKWGIVRW